MKNLILSIFLAASFAAAAPSPPALPGVKPVVKNFEPMKGGAALIAPRTPAAAMAVAPVAPVKVALAWDLPANSDFDCLTVWGSTNLADWRPMLTCASNATSCVLLQPTNSVMFFVIRAERQSPPSNTVTNSTISTH